MKRQFLITGIALLLIAGYMVYFRWSSAIRQPLQFNHSKHVKQRISCETCHANPLDESLPTTSKCLSCHKSMSLPGTVQWIPIYRIAPDIIFSHAKHMDMSCEICHKEMTSAKRWIHETRFKMDFCMECHDRMSAENKCSTCHRNR